MADKIELDPDKFQVVANSIREIRHALTFIQETMNQDGLTTQIRDNGLTVANYEFDRLKQFLGAEESVLRHEGMKKNLLRDCYAEIDRLRAEAAKGVSAVSIGARLNQLSELINKWWTQELGFLLCKVKVLPYSRKTLFNVEFSVHLGRSISSLSNTPVSDKEKVKIKRRELGKELQLHEEDGDEQVVLDNDNNRCWLVKKLTEKFPSIEIYKWQSMRIHKAGNNVSQITDIEAYIEIDDLEKMENSALQPTKTSV